MFQFASVLLRLCFVDTMGVFHFAYVFLCFCFVDTMGVFQFAYVLLRFCFVNTCVAEILFCGHHGSVSLCICVVVMFFSGHHGCVSICICVVVMIFQNSKLCLSFFFFVFAYLCVHQVCFSEPDICSTQGVRTLIWLFRTKSLRLKAFHPRAHLGHPPPFCCADTVF